MAKKNIPPKKREKTERKKEFTMKQGMESNMKNKAKRYLCDRLDEVDKKIGRIRVLAMVLIIIILGTASYIILNTKYSHEFEEYSAETYEMLNAIADEYIQENLATLSEKVQEYSFKNDGQDIIISYTIDAGEEKKIAPKPSMTVKISEDGSTITRESDYENEQSYRESTLKNLKMEAIIWATLATAVALILLVFEILIEVIAYNLSYSRKMKEMQREAKASSQQE